MDHGTCTRPPASSSTKQNAPHTHYPLPLPPTSTCRHSQKNEKCTRLRTRLKRKYTFENMPCKPWNSEMHTDIKRCTQCVALCTTDCVSFQVRAEPGWTGSTEAAYQFNSCATLAVARRRRSEWGSRCSGAGRDGAALGSHLLPCVGGGWVGGRGACVLPSRLESRSGGEGGAFGAQKMQWRGDWRAHPRAQCDWRHGRTRAHDTRNAQHLCTALASSNCALVTVAARACVCVCVCVCV
jgi:hypothetical protein